MNLSWNGGHMSTQKFKENLNVFVTALKPKGGVRIAQLILLWAKWVKTQLEPYESGSSRGSSCTRQHFTPQKTLLEFVHSCARKCHLVWLKLIFFSTLHYFHTRIDLLMVCFLEVILVLAEKGLRAERREPTEAVFVPGEELLSKWTAQFCLCQDANEAKPQYLICKMLKYWCLNSPPLRMSVYSLP